LIFNGLILFYVMFEVREEKKEKALIVGLAKRSSDKKSELYELEEVEALARTAGAIPIEKIIQVRDKPDPAFFIGKGRAQSLRDIDVDILLFNKHLSPAQIANLEELTGKKILDRQDIILDIFAQHARTKSAKIEVELAQLSFRLTRLTGRGKELSRLGGGIGTRGPGEKKLEVDRRKIRKRIDHLKREIKKIEKTREVQRTHRDGMFTVALLGYTNSGKSTLLNAFTHAGAAVNDQLFVTLDAQTRVGVTKKGNKFLLIDTVGFIRGIPTELMVSFKSTLEEAITADLRLILVDVSSEKYEDELEETKRVMENLGIIDVNNILVFNKIDRLYDPAILNYLQRQNSNAIFISATKKQGLLSLLERIDDYKKCFWN